MTKDSTITIHFGKFGYQYIVDGKLTYQHDLTMALANMLQIEVIESGNGRLDYHETKIK
jgi:hypothetical protein